MYKSTKILIVIAIALNMSTGCSEECDSQKFSSYCEGDTIVYCAYEGGIENTSNETVIREVCSEIDNNTPYCIEAPNEKNLFLRANCVISKIRDPNCNLEEPLKPYCSDNTTHSCYYGYTTHVSNKGTCSE